MLDRALIRRDVSSGLADHMLNGVACCKMEYRDGEPCDFVYLYTNQAFHRQTGLASVVGKRVTEVVPGIRRTDPELLQIYGRVAAGGHPERFETFVAALNDWFSIQVFCPRLGYFTAIFDVITEHKAAMQALQNQRDHLEELVAARTADLVTSKREAEAASLAKGAFLASMTHEIRTPLNAILGFTNLLMNGHLEAQAQREHLVTIDRASHHLLQVVNSVLQLSKLEAGGCKADCSLFDVGALLAEVGTFLSQAAHQKGLVLKTEVSGATHGLLGDTTWLKQALLNFAGNAVKFTEAGSVTLRAVLEHRRDDEALVRFEVEDTGAGISADVVSKLFVPFEQGGGSAARRHDGTGLGLAITRQLARLMGGDAGVKSTVGKGSTFWFTALLRCGPSAPSSVEPEATARGPADAAGREARILLVDDEPLNRTVAEAILRPLEAQVDMAVDGVEAIERCMACDYDLILMDMQMPRMGGVAAAAHLRREPRTAFVPIVAFTAYSLEDARAECIAAGIDDVLPKPVSADILLDTVLTHLRKPRQDRQAPVHCPQG